MVNDDIEHVKFRKQFFLCREEQTRLPSRYWTSRRVHDGWHLCHHEDLEISIAGSRDYTVALLGNAYDLDFTSRTNDEVAGSLVDAVDADPVSFSGFEERLSRLSGRHVVLVSGRDDDRVYHDASGLKSVFFAKGADDLCVGSQPALLEHFGKTRRDDSAFDAFVANPHNASFSAYYVPYENVTQLLPNRYLSLRTGSVHRFWPVEACRETSLQESADIIHRLTKASVEAHYLREKFTLTLTGGFDSRMILAATDPEIRKRLKITTSIAKATPDHDRWIPRKICKVLGLGIHQSRINDVNTSDSALMQQLHRNVGGMSFDASLPRVPGVSDALGDRVQGSGLCAGVIKDVYASAFVDMDTVTSQTLADVSGFGGNKLAIPGLERWLSELPDGWTSRQLDLLYWEQRDGVWASAHLAFKEALFEVSPLLNSRSILSAGIRAPRDTQYKAHQLSREVIRLGEPRLLDIPFHHNRWLSRLRRRLKLRYRLSRLKSVFNTA